MLFEKVAPSATSALPTAAAQSDNLLRPKGAAGRLVAAIQQLAQGHGTLVHHRETAWASITFSGRRHTIILSFTGPQAIAGGESLIAVLPDHEFTIPGKLVADAAVVEVVHRLEPEQLLQVTLDILVLDDA